MLQIQLDFLPPLRWQTFLKEISYYEIFHYQEYISDIKFLQLIRRQENDQYLSNLKFSVYLVNQTTNELIPQFTYMYN